MYPTAIHARTRLVCCQLGRAQTGGQAGDPPTCSPVARQAACSLLTLVLSGAMGIGPRWILRLAGGGGWCTKASRQPRESTKPSAMQRTHPPSPALPHPVPLITDTGQPWPFPPHVHISSALPQPQHIWEEHWAFGPHLCVNLLFEHHTSPREGKRLGEERGKEKFSLSFPL